MSELTSTRDWRGSGTLLVVDDDSMVRFAMTSVLRARGFTVLEAGDGREGLEIFAEHGSEIRAVLLDMSMPRMSGKEAFREMHRLHPEIPVILLSGYPEEEEASYQGLAGYLAKPFRPVALLAKLREILDVTESAH